MFAVMQTPEGTVVAHHATQKPYYEIILITDKAVDCVSEGLKKPLLGFFESL
jgi:hypothetical protein